MIAFTNKFVLSKKKKIYEFGYLLLYILQKKEKKRKKKKYFLNIIPLPYQKKNFDHLS